MKEQLETIRAQALAAFAAAPDRAALEELRVKYLGKKGELTNLLKMMGKLSPEERPVVGQLANEVREALAAALEERQKILDQQALDRRLAEEAVDVTIPGKAPNLGHRHPMYIALDEIKEIFIGMGFTVLDGPEIELAELNFDRLNAGEGHPSRDWSDTFYFDADSRVMLRSQTSPMQVRAMDSMPLPIRIIVGCPTCKGEGWIELLGAGMIHPKVLEMAGIDTNVYSGWAFGIGLERTAMRRFKIADLRLIFENDVRFLEQF